VLVRPDGFVGWRSRHEGSEAELREALDRILCR
jgi:hypothetical protein